VSSPARSCARATVEYLDAQFAEQIFPVLTPLAIDPAHPFPFIPNLGFTIAVSLTNRRDGKDFSALIPVPPQLKRFIRLPDTEHASPGDVRFIPLEEVIALYFDKLFPGHAVSGWGMFRILRDSDVEVEEEAEDLVLLFETLLKRRRRGSVIHMKCSKSMPEGCAISSPAISTWTIQRDRHHRKSDGTFGSVQADPAGAADLVFKPYMPRFPERIRDHGGDCFAAIREKDLIVHHPFESFDTVVQFLRQAAADPRCGGDQADAVPHQRPTVPLSALIEAAEAGKSVTALVELKARFDEAANIKWARDLERAGVQVVYGFIALKTHAKISLVVRREAGPSGDLCAFRHRQLPSQHRQDLHRPVAVQRRSGAGARRGAGVQFHHRLCRAQCAGKAGHVALHLRGRLVESIQQEIMHARRASRRRSG
jgi:polyphosphate kinase